MHIEIFQNAKKHFRKLGLQFFFFYHDQFNEALSEAYINQLCFKFSKGTKTELFRTNEIKCVVFGRVLSKRNCKFCWLGEKFIPLSAVPSLSVPRATSHLIDSPDGATVLCCWAHVFSGVVGVGSSGAAAGTRPVGLLAHYQLIVGRGQGLMAERRTEPGKNYPSTSHRSCI